MTQAEQQDILSAYDEYQAAADAYANAFPSQDGPMVQPGAEPHELRAHAALLRKAVERGEPATQEEVDKALRIDPKSWEW